MSELEELRLAYAESSRQKNELLTAHKLSAADNAALREFCQARIDDIETLRTALHLCREYPDFDDGGPIPEVIDAVLMGRPSPMIESYNKIQEAMDNIDAARATLEKTT